MTDRPQCPLQMSDAKVECICTPTKKSVVMNEKIGDTYMIPVGNEMFHAYSNGATAFLMCQIIIDGEVYIDALSLENINGYSSDVGRNVFEKNKIKAKIVDSRPHQSKKSLHAAECRQKIANFALVHKLEPISAKTYCSALVYVNFEGMCQIFDVARRRDSSKREAAFEWVTRHIFPTKHVSLTERLGVASTSIQETFEIIFRQAYQRQNSGHVYKHETIHGEYRIDWSVDNVMFECNERDHIQTRIRLAHLLDMKVYEMAYMFDPHRKGTDPGGVARDGILIIECPIENAINMLRCGVVVKMQKGRLVAYHPDGIHTVDIDEDDHAGNIDVDTVLMKISNPIP